MPATNDIVSAVVEKWPQRGPVSGADFEPALAASGMRPCERGSGPIAIGATGWP
jgi:hypothetical protein